MKKMFLLFLAMMMVVSLMGCSNAKKTEEKSTETEVSSVAVEESSDSLEVNKEESSDNVGDEKKIRIGVSMGSNIEYIAQLEAGLNKYAEEMDNIEMLFSNADGNAEKQLSDVESMIAQGIDVCIVRVIDPSSGLAVVEKLKEAGVHVVLQDIRLDTDKYDVLVTGDQAYVGNLIGGYIQNWLDEDTNRKCNLGYILGSDSEVLKLRETGIYDVVDSARIQSVISAIALGFSAEDALSYAEDWLITYPEMNAIACANDEMAVAVIQALNGAGVNLSDFLVFGVDGSELGQQYIKSGELRATVYQDVDKVAKTTLDTAVGIANGETFENKKVNPESFVLLTKDNIDEVVEK